MPMPTLVNLPSLIDDAKCFELVRQHRWPEGVRCPSCRTASVARHGRDDTQPHRQRYRCAACGARFDDLTGTALAGHHQPLRVWMLCLYFMGLNLSNRQIARELGLSQPDVQLMTERILLAKSPEQNLCGKIRSHHGAKLDKNRTSTLNNSTIMQSAGCVCRLVVISPTVSDRCTS